MKFLLGMFIRLQENLPEVTLVDLLKTFAAITKRGIDYNVETNTISFFDFNFNKSNGINLDDKVIDVVRWTVLFGLRKAEYSELQK